MGTYIYARNHYFEEGNSSSGNEPNNASFSLCSQQRQQQCLGGLLFQVWDSDYEDVGTTVYLTIIYVVALLYLLFGVSVVTDRIVSCSEVISNHKRSKTIQLKRGGTKVIKVRCFFHH